MGHSLFALVALFALECLSGTLGCLLGTLGCLLVCFGCLLGASWALLGASWRLLRALGTLLGALEAILGFQVDFLKNFGPKRGAKRDPKWHQNGTQNEPKSKTNLDIEKEALQDRLGAVLGRSWVIFGRPLGSFLLIFHWFLKLFVKIHFFQKISLQEPSWTELGPTWVDFGTQNGAKMAPKSDPKTIKTDDESLSFFGIEKRAKMSACDPEIRWLPQPSRPFPPNPPILGFAL